MNLNHTEEWWEGYHCQGPKLKNPYTAGQPWLAEHPDLELVRQCKDWFDGWTTRFHGEKP